MVHFEKFNGHVEVDETYIGGKARNMHREKRARVIQNRRGGSAGKVAVMGLLARHGDNGSQVRLEVVHSTR